VLFPFYCRFDIGKGIPLIKTPVIVEGSLSYLEYLVTVSKKAC